MHEGLLRSRITLCTGMDWIVQKFPPGGRGGGSVEGYIRWKEGNWERMYILEQIK